MINDSTKKRFFAKVLVLETECWEWQGAKYHFGHGSFRDEESRNERAHRFSWRLFNGEIPDSLCVLHCCDNPSCVNPAHLFLGTRQDNNKDRDAKGRMSNLIGRPFLKGNKPASPFPKGVQSGRPFPKGYKGGIPFQKGQMPPTFLDLDHETIRRMYVDENLGGTEIAKRLNVGYHPVYRILRILNLTSLRPHHKPSLRKRIAQYTRDGEFIQEWDSISDAAESLGDKGGTISNCLNGRRSTAKGFTWKYIS